MSQYYGHSRCIYTATTNTARSDGGTSARDMQTPEAQTGTRYYKENKRHIRNFTLRYTHLVCNLS